MHCSMQILNTEHSHNNYTTACPDYLNILKMYITSTQYTKNLTDVTPSCALSFTEDILNINYLLFMFCYFFNSKKI